MSLYLLPGLGFDHRIYQKIDWGHHALQFLDWIEPLKHEAISDYAERMAEKIKEEKNVILVGHSFGGMLAQEIAAIRPVDRIILLNSIQSRAEMPLFFKMVKPFGLYHFFTQSGTIRSLPLWGKSHGYDSPEEVALFISMVGKQSNRYLQWALKTLSAWPGVEIPTTTSLYQIHGRKDKTFPFSSLKEPDAVVDDGGHFMVFRQPEKVGRMILDAIH
ncbi:MAG: alpha/beta hydrolase [Bacteroidota bacterium]